MSNSVFTGNNASSGGGIANDCVAGMVLMSNRSFTGNRAAHAGGGIKSWGNAVVVSNSTFTDNRAGEYGGGIHVDYAGTLIVGNSTFTGNSANSGGGVYILSGTAQVSNSTFTSNSARNYGGGIFTTGGVTQVSNSTFSGNSAIDYGNGIYNDNNEHAVTTLRNTIVASGLMGSNCFGAIVNGGGNLSYPDTTCPGINDDPKLGPLQNNLGPTQTMTLLSGSAAIDAGNDAICAATPVNNRDQRGFSRP